jgi:hypothetical protein
MVLIDDDDDDLPTHHQRLTQRFSLTSLIAMGFMQQLERANGGETMAQIIPGSLEMALTPSAKEARVITLAKPPFLIVNVNQPWTRATKYTHAEVEGQPFLELLKGDDTTENNGDETSQSVVSHNLEDVAEGRCVSSTRLHFDKNGKEFVDFLSSYPLTK